MGSEFLRSSLTHNSISGKGGVDDLTEDFSASNSDDESIFRGVIFSFFLGNKSFSGIVISFSFSSSSVFSLESLEICVVFIKFNKSHCEY